MAITAKGKANGDAFITFLQAQASITAIVASGSIKWADHMHPEPVYPTNPRTELPLLRLREYVEDVGPGMNIGQAKGDCTYSLWYYRLQVVSQAHQTLLITDLETILNVLMTGQNWRPTNLQSVGGQSFYQILPQRPVVHDELRHKFDDPSLRISVGEIPMRFNTNPM